MRVATLLFLILLGVAHRDDLDAVDRPLSLFREKSPVVGYTLFGLLALIGGLHLRTYYRLGLDRQLFAPVCSLLLLAVVAVTPSPDGLHTLAALVLLGFVFGWYAFRLYRVASPWLFVHLAVPVLALVLTAAQSYGLWQKTVVVYFILAANIDCLLVTGRLVLPGPEDFGRARHRQSRNGYTPRVIWKRNDRPR